MDRIKMQGVKEVYQFMGGKVRRLRCIAGERRKEVDGRKRSGRFVRFREDETGGCWVPVGMFENAGGKS